MVKIVGCTQPASDVIVRRVRLRRNQTGQKALNATKFSQYVNAEAVSTMPGVLDGEVDVCFFKPKKWEYTHPGYMSHEDLQKALDRRNLENNPIAVIAVNKVDRTFADHMHHGAHWKDSAGVWCCITFHNLFRDSKRPAKGREVIVCRGVDGFRGGWRFAGVRKSVLKPKPSQV